MKDQSMKSITMDYILLLDQLQQVNPITFPIEKHPECV
jgi:hypothetical protein